MQQKKFNKLLMENKLKQDFRYPPKQLSYSDYLINFDLFYRALII